MATKFSVGLFFDEKARGVAAATAAAAAAFAMIIPGYGRKFLALPFLSLSIWFASLGRAYVQDNIADWVRLYPDGPSLHPDWYCVPAIVLVGSVPAIVMTMMLHRGVPLTPHLTAALGGLSAGSLVR